ncbi:MAG: lysoplasmalogenase [Flavobacteriales bacterium]
MDIRKNTPLNGVVYGLALLGTIMGGTLGMQWLVYLCKPLLMLVLSSWFYFHSRRVGDRFTLLVQAGLFFSWIGVIALMFQHVDQFNFLIGLAAFMIAQLCYTMAFAHNVADVPGGPFPWPSIVLSVVIAAYGYFFAGRILPSVDDGIVIPVMVYAIAISLKGIAAAFRFGRTFPRSFYAVVAGAFLFIASDSLLAFNRFVRPLDGAEWMVMLTYGLAQVLIAGGCLTHVLDPEEIRRRAALTT